MILKQSTAVKIPFFMVDSSDSITGKTGLSPTVTLSKDGAAFGAAGGSVTEIGVGWYYLSANTTDTNTLNALLLHATATGADPWDEAHQVCVDLPGASVSSVTGNVGGNVVGSVGSVTGAVASVTGNVGGNVVGSVGSVTGLTASNLDVAVSTRLATSGYTAPDNADIVAIKAKTDNLPANPASQTNLDVAVSTRLAAGSYTAPDNAGIAAIKAKTDNLPATPASQGDVTTVGTAVAAVSTKIGTPAGVSVSADIAQVETNAVAIKAKTDNLPANPASQTNLDVAVSSRLAASSYTAPDNADIAAIKAKTDNLPADPASNGGIWDVPIASHQTAGSTGSALETAAQGGGGGGGGGGSGCSMIGYVDNPAAVVGYVNCD